MRRVGVPVSLERVIKIVLTTGTAGSALLLAAGLAREVFATGLLHGTGAAWPHAFASPAHQPIVRAGLVVLMATPVGRVIVSVIDFGRQRDWAFFGVTLTVLGVLAMSLWVAVHQ